MRLSTLLVLLLLWPLEALLAQSAPGVTQPQSERRVVDRRILSEPPPGVEQGHYRIIRRTIHRSVEPQSTPADPKATTAPKSEATVSKPAPKTILTEESKPAYRYFVGAGFGYVVRERSIVVDTKNTGERIDLGGRSEIADGSSYSLTQDESELSPALELGVLGVGSNYYGAKLTLYQDFVEFSALAGMRLEPVNFKGLSPYLQAMGGIGYDGLSGLMPDNLTLGLGLGVDHALAGDYLYFNLMLSYQHRFWQAYKTRYGTEYWRDSEMGILGGFRYAF